MIPRFKNRPACEGTDTDMWFTTGKSDYPNRELLTRICNGCPAKRECLEYALEYNVEGWWAGTTSALRRQIRNHRGITAKPVMPDWEIRARGA